MEERQIQAEIGQRMQKAAEAKGLGPYDIALRLEVRPPTVYRWYQGEARPSLRSMRAFAALVGRSVAYLETGEEPGDSVSLLLIQWADAVAAGEPARRVYERLTPHPAFLNDREKERLARLAPAMLELATRLAGGRCWGSLSASEKTAAMAQLLELLDQVSPVSDESNERETGLR